MYVVFLRKSLSVLLLYITLAMAIGLPTSYAQKGNTWLKLQVIEADTKLPIPGALVVIKGRKPIVTDVNGNCSVPYDNSGKISLSIKSLGFKTVENRLYSVKGDVLRISLSAVQSVLKEVVVSAERKHTEVVQQTSTIKQSTIEKGSSFSLAKLLETVPGVSSISSGSSIAKPVIQGMHSSRILLINNGVRLESQSWGLDHAPEIDHTVSSIIEVIKGAESIRYGYGAVGGVVLLNQAKLPYGYDKLKVKGTVNGGFSSNSLAFDGNTTIDLGYKDFGLRLHAMYQQAGDYGTAEYLLNNTGYKNVSLSSLLGYKGDKLTINLEASLFYSRSGIYLGTNISDLDQLLARFEKGRPEDNTISDFSYFIKPPFQQTQHVTFKGDASWDINKVHNIFFRASYQENLRQEFENRKVEKFSWLPVQDLRLSTTNAEAIWTGTWGGSLAMRSQVGVSVMYQYNYNVPGTRQPAFIPNFAALTTGFFLLHKMTFFDKLTCSAGFRYDMRGMDVNGYTSLSSFNYYNAFKIYSNITGNAAVHYQFNDHLDGRVNLGWAWRPPDVNELYATGLHHGTYWVQGKPTLESERGYKAIIGGRYRTHWYSIEPSAFYQQIANYIYDRIGTGDERFHIHPSGKYPKFIYDQVDARIYGGDLMVTVVPIKHLELGLKGEWIFGKNVSQDTWLPFMPADKYTLSGEYQFDFGSRQKWHTSFGLEGKYVTKQTRFDPTKDLVPETPPAYFLLGGNAELSTTFQNGCNIKFMLLGDNMLNALYKEYTDRFRYYAHARGTQYTVRTIFTF